MANISAWHGTKDDGRLIGTRPLTNEMGLVTDDMTYYMHALMADIYYFP